MFCQLAERMMDLRWRASSGHGWPCVGVSDSGLQPGWPLVWRQPWPPDRVLRCGWRTPQEAMFLGPMWLALGKTGKQITQAIGVYPPSSQWWLLCLVASLSLKASLPTQRPWHPRAPVVAIHWVLTIQANMPVTSGQISAWTGSFSQLLNVSSLLEVVLFLFFNRAYFLDQLWVHRKNWAEGTETSQISPKHFYFNGGF